MQHKWNIILLQADTKKRGLQFVRVVSATDEQRINLQRTRHYNAKINMQPNCNFHEINLETMRPSPAAFLTNLHEMLGGHRVLPFNV